MINQNDIIWRTIIEMRIIYSNHCVDNILGNPGQLSLRKFTLRASPDDSASHTD